MPPHLLSPITKRILLVFLLSSSALFVVTSSVRLLLDYREDIASYDQHIDRVMALLAPPAGRALWNYDMQQLQAEIDPAIEQSGVMMVDVLDDRGQVVASRSQAAGASMAEHMAVRSIYRPGQLAPVGTLRLYLSYAPIRAGFTMRAMQVLLVDFFSIATLTALLFYMLHRHVIAHLLAITGAVEKFDPHGRSPQVIALRRRAPEGDELDQLAEAINRFNREIVEERAMRQQMEQQSRRLDGELARVARVATVQSLTTMIAHELNQPLGAILGNAETIELSMLERLPQDDPLREVLADIAHQARRAADIIRNLRNLIERRNIDVAPLALNPLVQQIVDLAQMDARASPVRIHLQLADKLPPVLGSAVQLQQVILNLIANARDAIALAGVADGHIAVVTRQDDPRWLRVAVIDNGPGIQPALVEHVFSAFFTTKDGGTGMGLWIAQMIVEQHGGELSVENMPSGGACFSFSLPVRQP
jgi:signal transduction histidine kinase